MNLKKIIKIFWIIWSKKENADPVYDRILAHKILSLVEKFGRINSHMTIKCSKLSIPAVIGCGEQFFQDIIKDQKK